MKTIRRTGLFPAALLLAIAALAADEGGSEREPESPQGAQQETVEPRAEKQPVVETPDTFTPSEEISEDLSVPFPVDI
ncbi:MAG: hypothetical protein HYY36_05030 [Gammaproteobacteria bacterium]|nr:hypothetical protein [Gammaproteobacteria bacterium]